MNTQAIKIISVNKKAKFDYEIQDSYEVGIVLTGTEVKSIRLGHVNLKDSYARFINEELWLINSHISEYKEGNRFNHEVRRNRKLLLHRKELKKIHSIVKESGLTLIPIKIYFKKGKAKIELGLCKGKKDYDKRESLKQKELDKEIKRVSKEYG